jgi:transcriptional regulator with XRE-family HTH domain
MYGYRVSGSHGVELELLAGSNLRALRTVRHWSLREATERFNAKFGYSWHQTVLAKAETGERPLRLSEAIDLASLYGASLSDLIGTLAPDFTLTAEELDAQIALARKRAQEAQERLLEALKRATAAEGDALEARFAADQARERRSYFDMELRTLEARRDML